MIGVIVDLFMDITGLRRKAQSFGKNLGEQIFDGSDEKAETQTIKDDSSKSPNSKSTIRKKKGTKVSKQERNAMLALGIAGSLIVVLVSVLILTQKPAAKKMQTAARTDADMTSGAGSSGVILLANQSGYKVDLASALVRNKKNILYFHSSQCPSCHRMEPLLKKLAAARSDLSILKVDIDREGVEGIDFNSPTAQQFNIDRVPFFRIYDGTSRLVIASGKEAKTMVKDLMAKE